MKNSLILFLLLISVVLVGCSNESSSGDYEKCTSVCAAIVDSPELEEGFVMLELCREECKKQFLE
ncbi:hypothetical protein ISS07_05250 [Candidatus Woesearchaeota archaeon]|nr:hypothetical protein [Candidatus Woesearchaeota archaeon]